MISSCRRGVCRRGHHGRPSRVSHRAPVLDLRLSVWLQLPRRRERCCSVTLTGTLIHSRSCLWCHGRCLCLTWLAANPLRLGRKATLTPLLPHCTFYSLQQLQYRPSGPFAQPQITYRSVRPPMDGSQTVDETPSFRNPPSPPQFSSLVFKNHSIQYRYQCSYIAPSPDAPRRLSMVPLS